MCLFLYILPHFYVPVYVKKKKKMDDIIWMH